MNTTTDTGPKAPAVWPFKEHILQALQQMGIDHEGWMQRGDKKPIDRFVEAIENGEMDWDWENRSRELHVHVAAVHVRYDDAGAPLELFHVKAAYPNGLVHRRRQEFRRGLGEKIAFAQHETPYMAAVRGLAEELGPAKDGFASPYNYDIRFERNQTFEQWESEYYRGFMDTYHRRIHVCTIPRKLYAPFGYLAKEPDRTNHWAWQAVPV